MPRPGPACSTMMPGSHMLVRRPIQGGRGARASSAKGDARLGLALVNVAEEMGSERHRRR